MLLLSRRVGEKIMIQTPAGDIWLAVVDIDRGKARIGIDAPREYPIYREELLGEIERRPTGGGE